MEESTFQRHISAMMDAELVAVDTETTGLNVKDGRDYCMGISVAYRLGPLGIMSAYFPFRHPSDNLPKEWVSALQGVLTSRPVVFHNLKFDLHSLRTIGLAVGERVFDTLNIAHMYNEELPSKGLDYLSKRFLKDEKDKRDELDRWIKAFGWGTVPAGLMAPYACKDAELTLRLFEYFWPKFRTEELTPLWPTERAFTRLLFSMEGLGVGVDQAFCARKAHKGRDRMAAILDELDVESDSLGPTALSKLLFDELSLPVVKRTEKGKPCFDKDAMEQYDEILEGRISSGVLDESARNVASLILEYRGWQKAVTSLYEPLLNLVSPDGRVRPNFKQHGTRTGRLSCAEPNLQQIPRKTDKVWNGDAKQAFVAADGFELVGYDYSQLEFRLAAAYGRERWLLDEFSNPDGDVFTAMAERANAPRQTIKTYTYATLYGAGLSKIAATLGVPEAEIKDTYEAFKESISGIRHTSQVATQRAKQRGYVKYWTGRRRHFPWDEGHHKAFNSLLQGGGAELVKRAMLSIHENVCDDNCRIVLQVHDEIVLEVRQGMRDLYEPRIIEIMTNFPEFGVPFKVEGKEWTGRGNG